jgi:hypothetical protein
VGAALLSGCAGKEQASTSLPAPTSTAAPTTAALPPLGPPDFPVPAAARTKDAAGAEAFVRYWIALLNKQQAIPAGQPLRQLGPHCSECLRIARFFDEAAAKNEHYEGGTLGINSFAAPTVIGGKATVAFNARGGEIRLVSKAGKVVETVPKADKLGSGMALEWSDALPGWVATSFALG